MGSSFASVLPGARVRGEDGFIGTVERLEHHWAAPDERPDRMIVRSDDRRWRYSIPLMFVSGVSQGALYPLIVVGLHQDDLLYYVTQEIPPERTAAGAVPARAPRDEPAGDGEPEVLRVPLAEEELVARKQPVPLGMAHVHKGFETTEARILALVYHEEAVIERIPADQFDASAATNPNEVIIPVIEERLVVRREQVVAEYIRVRKTLVGEPEEVQGQVRHEYVTVTEDGREGHSPTTLFDSRAAAEPRDPWVVTPYNEPDADQPGSEEQLVEGNGTDSATSVE